MKALVFTLLFVASTVSAQSNLPACRGADSSRWTMCFGTTTFGSRDMYVGEFRDGQRHGEGTYYFLADNKFKGDKYVGGYRDGMRSGQGTYTHVNGDKYVGGWKDSKFHGQGTYTYANGDKYVGTYKDDRRNGHGIYAFASGNRYVGESKDNKFSGLGIHTYADGRPPREGIWEENKFLRAQRIPDHIAGRTSTASPRQAEPARPTIALSILVSQPNADGVVTLTISTNSDTASLKINGDEEGGRTDGRYSVRKFAQVGENKFEVVAVDRSGNTQRQTVSVVRQPADNVARFAALNPVSLKARPPRDAVAIIIGIQDYRRVSKADFANNDARRFYDYAIRGLGVPAGNIKLLLDDKADDIEILGAFKNWLPLKTRKGQTDVYVFYSGHGYPSDDGASLYFLPHGVDRQFLDRSAIKQSDIVQALQAVTPKSVTLFLDACYSGQSRTGETLLAGARPISIQPKASTFPSNFTVLSASAPEQIASSSPELKHGIFSYFLMKGMEGEADQNKDGVITVQEMQSYLSDSVGRKAMSLSRTQQPQVIGDQTRVLVGQ